MCYHCKKSSGQSGRDQAQIHSMSSLAVQSKAGKNDNLFNITTDDVSCKKNSTDNDTF